MWHTHNSVWPLYASLLQTTTGFNVVWHIQTTSVTIHEEEINERKVPLILRFNSITTWQSGQEQRGRYKRSTADTLWVPVEILCEYYTYFSQGWTCCLLLKLSSRLHPSVTQQASDVLQHGKQLPGVKCSWEERRDEPDRQYGGKSLFVMCQLCWFHEFPSW